MVGRAFDNPMAVQGRFEEELKAAINEWGRDSLQAAEASMLLGHATMELWQKRKRYDRALEIVHEQVGNRHALYGRYLLEAAASLIEYDAYRRGDDYLERAQAYFAQAFPGGSTQAAQVPLYRGFMSERDKKLDDAAQWFSRAAQIVTPLANENDDARELLKTAHSSAVRVLELSGDRDSATAHCVALARLAAADGNTMPRQLLLVPPKYPNKLLRKKIEGAVTFSFTVDERGIVDNVDIESIEGPDAFGDALLETIERWRFSPQLKDGVPVTARLRNRYLFSRDELPSSADRSGTR